MIIDWLFEVTENLKLHKRTMYHAVNILDRFLSDQKKRFDKDMDQQLIMLQGLSCLFISSKNLEMDPTVPSSKKFLLQLPGYKPTKREQRREDNIYKYGINKMQGDSRSEKFDAQKNELCEQE